MVVRGRKAILERSVDVRPGAHGVAPGRAVDLAAVAVDADPVARLDAEALVHRDAELREHREQLGVRADTRAARRQVVADALEDLDFPAEAAQQVGGEQPAERAADHCRARFHSGSAGYYPLPWPPDT